MLQYSHYLLEPYASGGGKPQVVQNIHLQQVYIKNKNKSTFYVQWNLEPQLSNVFVYVYCDNICDIKVWLNGKYLQNRGLFSCEKKWFIMSGMTVLRILFTFRSLINLFIIESRLGSTLDVSWLPIILRTGTACYRMLSLPFHTFLYNNKICK